MRRGTLTLTLPDAQIVFEGCHGGGLARFGMKPCHGALPYARRGAADLAGMTSRVTYMSPVLKERIAAYVRCQHLPPSQLLLPVRAVHAAQVVGPSHAAAAATTASTDVCGATDVVVSGGAPSWVCGVCSYAHRNATERGFLACGMCYTERPATA